MLRLIQEYRLDAIAFAVLLTGSAIIAHIWLKRRHGRGIFALAWGILAALLIAGFVAPEITGDQERNTLRKMISGLAPTYAQEFVMAGHERITLDTPVDDPLYLSLIAAEKRWEKINPNVKEIYTMRRQPDGKVVILVDAESDFNRNGSFESDSEARTAIGEPYEEVTEPMTRAFAGEDTFDDTLVADPWGLSVAAFVPLRNSAGEVEAILGVDYDARSWLTEILSARGAALGGMAVLSVILLASTVVVVMTRAELRRRELAERERAKLQQQLIAASRQAGMAEIATNVLHNVGNILNSVNISVTQVAEILQKSQVPALTQAVGIVQEHRADLSSFLTSGRGSVLPDYLLKLSEALTSDHRATTSEVNELARSVDHIKQIVASQQAFARHAEEGETFELCDLVEEALRINCLSEPGYGFEIEQKLAKIEPVTADRHKLLQIIVNLLSNAKNAVKANTGAKCIEIRSETATGEDGHAVVRVVVKDNGVGINSWDLGKLFMHGFTTRKDGHGFGLHSSAIAAKQMKGRILAASDGPGLGTSFTIELPAAELERKAA